MNLKNGLLAAAFAILGVVAVAGWSRSPAPAGQFAATASPVVSASTVEPQYDSYGRPIATTTVASPCVGYSSAAYEQQAPERREIVNESSSDRIVYRTPHHRSTRKSVAIVAGSAAAGAGIGAIAGGGKGAGIGALAGGAGGFIYDRLTHNR